LLALVPLAIIAIISTESRMGANTAQIKEVREAANEIGIVVQGGITRGQTLRFCVARLGTVVPGPPDLRLTILDSQGNPLASHLFSGRDQNRGVHPSFFDFNADQIPQDKFDGAGRLELVGVIDAVDPTNPSCGFVASGEVFDNFNGRTSSHIAGQPLLTCGKASRP